MSTKSKIEGISEPLFRKLLIATAYRLITWIQQSHSTENLVINLFGVKELMLQGFVCLILMTFVAGFAFESQYRF